MDAGDGVGSRGHKITKATTQGTEINSLKIEKGAGELRTTFY